MQLTIRTQSQHDGVETSFHMKDTNFDITFRNVGSVVDERYSLGGARVQGWPPGTWEYVSGRRHRPRRGSRKRPVGNWILQTRSMIIINQFKASLNWFLVSCQVFFLTWGGAVSMLSNIWLFSWKFICYWANFSGNSPLIISFWHHMYMYTLQSLNWKPILHTIKKGTEYDQYYT